MLSLIARWYVCVIKGTVNSRCPVGMDPGYLIAICMSHHRKSNRVKQPCTAVKKYLTSFRLRETILPRRFRSCSPVNYNDNFVSEITIEIWSMVSRS